MRRSQFPILALILLATAFQSASVTGFQARLKPEDRNIVEVMWNLSSADAAAAFRLERSLGDATQFVTVWNPIVADGRNGPNGVEFRFEDRSVYKQDETRAVYYRLVVIQSNGSTEIRGPVTVNYTSTAIRRTWGSIKSMFQ